MARKKQRPNPFDGRNTIPIAIDAEPVVKVDPQTGIIWQRWQDPSGLSSGWDPIGFDGPKWSLPPKIGDVPEDVIALVNNSQDLSFDALLARSAVQYCNETSIYNSGLYSRGLDAYNIKKSYGVKRLPPEPQQPEMDVTKRKANTPYYRPVSFELVYAWMRTKGALPPFAPEYNYNQ